MTRLLAIGLVAATTACGGRTVNVRTGEVPVGDASIVLTNSLAQAVNVYVTPASGGEIFVRQVVGGATETLGVRGVTGSTTVRLRATTIDGKTNYSRENVTLGGGYVWRVP